MNISKKLIKKLFTNFMELIILAAGRGSRLPKNTENYQNVWLKLNQRS